MDCRYVPSPERVPPPLLPGTSHILQDGKVGGGGRQVLPQATKSAVGRARNATMKV